MRALFCLIAFTLIFNALAQVPCDVHSCDYATATEGTTVSNSGTAYTPKCLRVAPGTVVTFTTNFDTHPLVSGTFQGSAFQGTIVDQASGSASVSFNMTVEGPNPFYCERHAGIGMVGVIYVGDSCAVPAAPTAATPTAAPTAAPTASPVAAPTKVPAAATPVKKTSSAVAVQIGALSLLAVLAL